MGSLSRAGRRLQVQLMLTTEILAVFNGIDVRNGGYDQYIPCPLASGTAGVILIFVRLGFGKLTAVVVRTKASSLTLPGSRTFRACNITSHGEFAILALDLYAARSFRFGRTVESKPSSLV